MQDAVRRTSNHTAPYTVLQTHRVLHRALHQASHRGLINKNPAALVLPPRPRRREMTALAPDELRRLFAYTREDRLYPLWVVLGTAGLRIGEASVSGGPTSTCRQEARGSDDHCNASAGLASCFSIPRRLEAAEPCC